MSVFKTARGRSISDTTTNSKIQSSNIMETINATVIQTIAPNGIVRNVLDDGSGNATISGVLTNTVGGDISGTALNAVTISKLQGQTLTLGTPSTNQVIAWNGSAWVNTTFSGGGGVSSLNGLTGALTIQSPNGTLNVSTSSPNINIDFNLANSNAWTALQTFPDIEVITGTGQALALGVLYNTVGTSQLDSPSLYFVGTGYYNTSGGLATMPWQFYNNISGGSSTAQSASIFTINPPNNTAFNSFKIFNSSFVLANIIGGDTGFQTWNYNTALGTSLTNFNIGGHQFQINGIKQFVFPTTKVSTDSTGTITDLYSLWYSYITSSQIFKLDYVTNAVQTKNNTLDDGSGNVSISGGATVSGVLTNTVGGDLSGTALNAVTIAKLQGQTLTLSTPSTNQIIAWNGTAWVNTAPPASGVSSLNTLTGSVTIQSPNGTINVTASSPNINIDFNLSHSNAWTTLQTFPDIEIITGTGQALALGTSYTTAGTSQLNSPGLNFTGTGYYNTTGGLATMSWQFYESISGGSTTAQSLSTFTINPPNNTSANYFNILNIAPTSAGTYNSSAFVLSGFGYDTTSHEVDWLQQVQVTSQAGASTYHIQHRIGTNAYTDALTITDAGNVTIAGNATISGVITNTVGGDISGTALNAITIAKLQGQTLSLGTPSTNQVIAWNGTAWVNTSTVASLNSLTGTLTIASPNSTLSISTASPNINLDINLGNSNIWTASQMFSGGISFSNQSSDVLSGALTGLRTAALNLIGNADGTTARPIQLQTQTVTTAGVANAATRLIVNAGAAQGAVGMGLYEALYFAGAGTSFSYGSQASLLADASGGNLILNAPSAKSILGQIAGTTAMTVSSAGVTHTGYVYAQGANYKYVNPSNPTGTKSTSLVFMGLGSSATLTPKFSGRLRIVWNGTGSTSSLTFFKVQPAHGTGTAPSNGSSATSGLDLSAAKSLEAGAAAEGADFTFSYVLTGLTVGTAYWFDIALASGNSSYTASITNITFYATEF
jgi:hypothetical protein